MTIEKTLWELLWDYDPNGLVVLDDENRIQVVNSAFCAMFHLESNQVIGQHAGTIFEDLSDFQAVRDQDQILNAKENEYPGYGLYLRSVIFPVKDQHLVACIMVDLTSEHQRQAELIQMKQEMLIQVDKVIDKQMKIAQEIASLLGETTAEAKVSLLRIRNLLNEEIQ